MFQFERRRESGHPAAVQVLLTGAFGRLGQAVLRRLLSEGDSVVAFDVPRPGIKRAARRFRREQGVEIIWGDMRHAEHVAEAVREVDAVIHLAGILAPPSEIDPEYAYDVNVRGTQHVIDAAAARDEAPRIVFASSVSVCGVRQDAPVVTSTDPAVGTDHYTSHKAKCEQLLRESGLPCVILRISASVSAEGGDINPDVLQLLFSIDPDNKLEYVHPDDVATAMVNATRARDVVGKVLMVGGGEPCRITFREFYGRIFDAVGVGALPDAAYSNKPYYTNWMDTAESQALLQYQSRTFDDLIEETRARRKWQRPAIRLMSPFIRRWMLSHSEAWKARR